MVLEHIDDILNGFLVQQAFRNDLEGIGCEQDDLSVLGKADLVNHKTVELGVSHQIQGEVLGHLVLLGHEEGADQARGDSDPAELFLLQDLGDVREVLGDGLLQELGEQLECLRSLVVIEQQSHVAEGGQDEADDRESLHLLDEVHDDALGE